MLDEQSFQGLLAAAFTIQQHNDRQRGADSSSAAGPTEPRPKPQAAELCRHCGAPLATDHSCPSCSAENFRPGERLQRTWASMWLKSQEQGLWPNPQENAAPGTPPSVPAPNGDDPADFHVAPSSPAAKSEPARPIRQETTEAPKEAADDLVISYPSFDNLDKPSFDNPSFDDASFDDASLHHPELDLPPAEIAGPSETPEQAELSVPATALFADVVPQFVDSADNDSALGDSADHDPAALAATTSPGPVSRVSDLRVKLRFHRADLYLGIAVLAAAIALLWPASAPQRPTLRPWERILIAMGIADPPAAVTVHYPGDPNIKVWVDPHAALYYCPGEELYGKSPDGHFSTQRDAQVDRFEPAERSACVE